MKKVCFWADLYLNRGSILISYLPLLKLELRQYFAKNILCDTIIKENTLISMEA